MQDCSKCQWKGVSTCRACKAEKAEEIAEIMLASAVRQWEDAQTKKRLF